MTQDNRPKQVNCQQEPPYPEHHTVLFCLRAPNMVCHLSTERCQIEYPHEITACGEYHQ